MPPFELRVTAGQFSVRDALREILRKLEPLGFVSEETDAIELVLAEVLNNVFEHAYPNESQTGEVSINCDFGPKGLSVSVCDWGMQMPNGHAPLGARPSSNLGLTDLPEGGFGWFLIQSLAKDVVYERDGGMNKLSLRMAVGLDQFKHA